MRLKVSTNYEHISSCKVLEERGLYRKDQGSGRSLAKESHARSQGHACRSSLGSTRSLGTHLLFDLRGLALDNGLKGYSLCSAHTDLREMEMITHLDANLRTFYRTDALVDLGRSSW